MKLQNVPDYQVLERVDAAILMEIGADDLNEVETGLRTKRVDTSVGLVEGRRHFVVVLAIHRRSNVSLRSISYHLLRHSF